DRDARSFPTDAFDSKSATEFLRATAHHPDARPATSAPLAASAPEPAPVVGYDELDVIVTIPHLEGHTPCVGVISHVPERLLRDAEETRPHGGRHREWIDVAHGVHDGARERELGEEPVEAGRPRVEYLLARRERHHGAQLVERPLREEAHLPRHLARVPLGPLVLEHVDRQQERAERLTDRVVQLTGDA